MSLQYITDAQGKTTGVFIPIQEWDSLKSKYEGIEEEAYTIPEWHKDIVRERIKSTNKEDYLSWEEVKKNISNEL